MRLKDFFLRFFFFILLAIFNSGNSHAVINEGGPDISKGTVQEKGKEGRYKEGELLVKFRPNTPETRKDGLHKKHGSKKIKEFPSLRIENVKLKKGMTVEEAIGLYSADPNMEYAEPNFIVSILATPNDPRFGELWGLHNTGQSGGTLDADIDAPEAWDTATGSSDVVVAVIDTGVDYTHEDLSANMWTNPLDTPGNGIDDDGNGYVDDIYGIDTINNDSDPFDDNGHGTHVSGTIGAEGDNGIGVAGVNWNVKIMACKFLGSGGWGDIADAVECLEYIKGLKDRGVNILATSNSWGCSGSESCYSQSLYDAINAQREILFIAAAGNNYADNDSYDSYPANYYLPNLLSIAATDRYDAKASFSDYGRRTVHVGAPGASILSSLPAVNIWGMGGGYGLLSGTSMATPHVSGLAALLKASDPAYDWIDIRNLILSGGDNIGSMSGKTITGKRINASGSLNCTNSPVFSVLKYPALFDIGVPETLSALSINCELPVGPVTVTLSTGEVINLLDDGVTPDLAAGDGIFSGTWTPSGWNPVTLTFSSSTGEEVVSASSLLIKTTYLPEASTLQAYSFFIEAAGGVPPYSWSLASGSLPGGLSLNSSTGDISGTAISTGTFYFSVRVTDALDSVALKSLSLYVTDSPVVQIWSKSFDTGGHDYAVDIALDGDDFIYVTGHTQKEDSTHDYLTIKYDTAGNILQTESYDGGGDDFASGIGVDRDGNVYVAGSSQNGADTDYVTIKYDSSGNVLWTKTYDTGGNDFSEGIAIDNNGNVYVTGYYNFNNWTATYAWLTIKYDTAGNLIWTATYHTGNFVYASGVTVDGNGNVYVTGFSGSRPDALVTIKYDSSGNTIWSKSFDGGYDEYSRGIAADPAGNIYVTGFILSNSYRDFLTLKYDDAGNLKWWRIHDNGNYEGAYDITADDIGNVYITGENLQSYETAYQTIKYSPFGDLIWSKREPFGFLKGGEDKAVGIAVDGKGNIYVTGQYFNYNTYDFRTSKYYENLSLLRIITSSLPSGIIGMPFSQPLHASGGETPYFWSITAGNLPDGLVLNSSTGEISGVPAELGSFNFTLMLTDASSKTISRELTIHISYPLEISTTSFPDGTYMEYYSQGLAATGGLAPYTWSFISANVPTGLSLSPTGLISGTPRDLGTFNFTVKVTDSNYSTAAQALSITIYESPVITTSSLPDGTVNLAYNQTLSATGGKTPYSWSIVSGSLPPGLALNGSTGEISGTPAAAGTYDFTARVTDANGTTADKALSIIVCAPLAVTTTWVSQGNVCNAYTWTLAAEGGLLPYTWSLASGSLPGGLTLNSATGEIYGTPASTGIFSLTVQVMDAQSNTAGTPLAVNIQSPMRISGTPFNYLLLGDAYSTAPDGGTIEVPAINSTEDLTFDQAKSVALKGGYDCGFTSNPSYSTINGNITNTDGTITLEKIKLNGVLTINGGTVIPDNMIIE